MRLTDGYTLMHEHVTIDLSGVKGDEDCRLDCLDETIEEFRRLYAFGVRNILDVTNLGMGRNVEYVRKVSEKTGIHILTATGFYKEPFFPDYVYTKSVQELAQIMEMELNAGLKEATGCDIHAAVIGEFGTGKNRMTPTEKKVFDAAAIAAKKTGARVTTHTTLGTFGEEQADYLISHGVKPENIIIGHMDLSQNMDIIFSVLKKGVNIGFDTIGKTNYCPDAFRAEALRQIAKNEMLSQVVLSMDITRKSHLSYRGGIGYSYLFEKFIPLLLKEGFTQAQIDMLLKENPRRILLTP